MFNSKDRLMTLHKKAFGEWCNNGAISDISDCEYICNYLLANGIIVAPMPMADWLREELTEHVYKRCMEEL